MKLSEKDKEIERLNGLLAERSSVLDSPERWMEWCDSKVLDENDALKLRIEELEAQLRSQKDECERFHKPA